MENDMDEQGEEELGQEIQSIDHEAQREQMLAQLQHDNNQLQAENKRLKGRAQCPCGGYLEGIGYDRTSKTVVFECAKCKTQLLLEQKVWAEILKSKP